MYEHKNGIRYRKIEQIDLCWLFDLKQESWWGTHGSPIINRDDQEKWYSNLGNDTLVMIAQAYTTYKKDINEAWLSIGVGIYSNIDWIARTCDLSGSIRKAFRGKEEVPNAFECGLDFGFEMLNMHRIQCEVVEYNLAAQKLEIEHLGFRVEGRRRKVVYKAGDYYDSILLGILRDEWLLGLYKRGDRSYTNNNSEIPCCNKNVDHEKNRRSASRAMDLESG